MTPKTPTNHKVTVAAGTTINTGNYENLRLDFGLEIEGQGNPDATFEKAWAWVEGKLVEKTREIQESL